MAKTQYSFSHDPKLKGVPTGLSLALVSLQKFIYAMQVLLSRSVLFDCQRVLASFTPSLATCKLCQGLAHDLVSQLLTIITCCLILNTGFWEVGLDPETGKVLGLF
jgi:hypothetical protein